MKRLRSVLATLAVTAIIAMAGFQLVYNGRIFPGVTAAGAYLGGMSRADALEALDKAASEYQRALVPMMYGNTTVQLPVAKLELKYNHQAAVDQAMAYGRGGGFWQRLAGQWRAMLGKRIDVTHFTYSDDRLHDYLMQIDADFNRPVTNAALDFAGEQVQITPGKPGSRIDLGRLTQTVLSRLSASSDDPIAVPAYNLPPLITAADLSLPAAQAKTYLSGPLELSYRGNKTVVERPQILGWLSLTRQPSLVAGRLINLNNFYNLANVVTLDFNTAAINAFVNELAAGIDQPGQNAQLQIENGRATVFEPSRDGLALDRPKTAASITRALKSRDQRSIQLTVSVSKPTVREENLNDLGIKELISRGETTFPGSDEARLVNIRVGAGRFNGVLLKPDQVFSFGEILGDVGPEQGYLPAPVILAHSIEKQYGGGLCQVSTTAFRAALLAGLPIMERVNHSFVVPYYTSPYGVPGVDAAIYYPISDLKFRNDTGSYILIQTRMEGITLTFDFYGTKTKSARIRGPQFISGSSDATKPSQTVFWRDILDLNGNVIKTSAFTSTYASSLDFPRVAEIH